MARLDSKQGKSLYSARSASSFLGGKPRLSKSAEKLQGKKVIRTIMGVIAAILALTTLGAVTAHAYGTKCNFSVKIASRELCNDKGGVEIHLSDIKDDHPVVTYHNANDETIYTLLMLDPDAPNSDNPVYADWIHMAYCNIPGEELKKGFDGSGKGFKKIFGYEPPSPPKGSGFHRYEFLLLRQEDDDEINDVDISKRSSFDRQHFMNDHDLVLIGETYFLTRRE